MMLGLEPANADRLTEEIEADINRTRKRMNILFWLLIPTLGVSFVGVFLAVKDLNDRIRAKLCSAGITSPEDHRYLMFLPSN
jgi:hypothetical protein